MLLSDADLLGYGLLTQTANETHNTEASHRDA